MTVQHATLEQLQTTHRGAIITPDDSRYDEGRRVWNAMIDRRPAVIVRCRSAADVMSAVNYWRDNALPIAVRGGAHGIAGMGTCNDGLVIDFVGHEGHPGGSGRAAPCVRSPACGGPSSIVRRRRSVSRRLAELSVIPGSPV